VSDPKQYPPTGLRYSNIVYLCKPALTREGAFTDKTGGCNSKASVLERMSVYVPVRVRQADRE